MAQIIDIDPDTRCWFRNSQENPAAADGQNAQGRVLLEVAVTLAIAGILVAAAAYFAPALS